MNSSNSFVQGTHFLPVNDFGCFSLKLFQLWLYLFLHVEPKLHISHTLNYWVISWRWSWRPTPCHYFTTLESVTAISPYTSSSTRLMYQSHRDRQMKGSWEWRLALQMTGKLVVEWVGRSCQREAAGWLVGEQSQEWDSGCCGQGHGYSPGRGSFTTLVAVERPRCRRPNASNSLPDYFLIPPCSPFRGIALSWEYDLYGQEDFDAKRLGFLKTKMGDKEPEPQPLYKSHSKGNQRKSWIQWNNQAWEVTLQSKGFQGF